jgi:hypothetical protein
MFQRNVLHKKTTFNTAHKSIDGNDCIFLQKMDYLIVFIYHLYEVDEILLKIFNLINLLIIYK